MNKTINLDDVSHITIKNHGWDVQLFMKNGDKFVIQEAISLGDGKKSLNMTLQKNGVNRMDSAVECLYMEYEPLLKSFIKSKTKANKQAIIKFLVELWNEQIVNLKPGWFNVPNPKVTNYKVSKKERKKNMDFGVTIGRYSIKFEDMLKV